MLGLIGFILCVAALALWKSKVFNWKKAILCFTIGIAVLVGNGAFYEAQTGYSYLVQYPWGTQVVHTDPGWHLIYWGKKFPFKKVVTVKFSNADDNSEYSGVYAPVDAKFNDTVTADVSFSPRFKMPTNKEAFKNMAVEYRTQENLIGSTLSPFCQEAVRNAARRLSAQEYVGGRGGQFESDVLDQIRNGIYQLRVEDVTGNNQNENVVQHADRLLHEGKIVRQIFKPVLNKDGSIKRKENPIVKYGITCTQAPIENVVPEKEFRDRLKNIKSAAAKAQEQKQLAIAAEQEKRKVIAEGETTKAQKRITQEEKQIVILINAETDKKKAAIALEEEKLNLEKARIAAQNKRVTAEADAYAKQKAITADGALDKKLAALETMAKYTAEGWANRKVPQTVIGGNANGGGDAKEFQTFMNMMMVEYAKKLNVDMSIKR